MIWRVFSPRRAPISTRRLTPPASSTGAMTSFQKGNIGGARFLDRVWDGRTLARRGTGGADGQRAARVTAPAITGAFLVGRGIDLG